MIYDHFLFSEMWDEFVCSTNARRQQQRGITLIFLVVSCQLYRSLHQLFNLWVRSKSLRQYKSFNPSCGLPAIPWEVQRVITVCGSNLCLWISFREVCGRRMWPLRKWLKHKGCLWMRGEGDGEIQRDGEKDICTDWNDWWLFIVTFYRQIYLFKSVTIWLHNISSIKHILMTHLSQFEYLISNSWGF